MPLPSRRRSLGVSLLLCLALLVAACSSASDAATESSASQAATSDAPTAAETKSAEGTEPAQRDPGETEAPSLVADSRVDGCGGLSPDNAVALNEAGQKLFANAKAKTYPIYDLDVSIDPVTGELNGSMTAIIPDAPNSLQFRVFAGMDAFNSGLEVTDVRVNGAPAEMSLDTALLTVANPDGEASTDVEMAFTYTLQETAATASLLDGLSGQSLSPDKVGLLGRTDSGAQLGHWFPIWLPPVARADASPGGFGDIGAFPNAGICARVSVPEQYAVVTGGTRVAKRDSDKVGWATHEEGGLGLRDLAILISDELVMTEEVVEGVDVRVWGPADSAGKNADVLDFAVTSQQALANAFGPYPWQEIDVVSAPLGSGVGGMEWPGMVWIESGIFAGGLPQMEGLAGMEGLLDDPRFEDLVANIPGMEALDTMLEWTVAHELGHEWWHALVGNDSIESPAVDEPLAQYAACVAMQDIHPEHWRDICESQTYDSYAQARSLMGVADAAADQPSDAFDSSVQYGAVVYGKAPGFYFEAADLLGGDVLNAALADFIAGNPFSLVSTDALRQHIIDAARDSAGPDAGEQVGELWNRWFREARGDEDIEVPEGTGLGAFGDLGDLEGLLSGGADLDDLFGDLLAQDGLGDLLGEDGLGDLGDLLGEDGLGDLGDLFEGGAVQDLLGDEAMQDLLGDGGVEGLLADETVQELFESEAVQELLADENVTALLAELLGG